MSNANTIASYPMKITELREQITNIGNKVYETELVQITLNGFSTS